MKKQQMNLFGLDYFNKVIGDSHIEKHLKQEILSVRVVRGESALAQFVLRTEDDIVSYYVNIYDLKDQKNQTFSRKNIDIYHQKHIFIETPSKHKEKTGLFSDALLPLEVARKHHEAYVTKGYNQGVLLSVNAPKDTLAGVYEGFIEVNLGGIIYNLPLKIEVLDFELEGKTSFRSSVNIGSDGLYMGEGKYFPENYRAYSNHLLSFKLSPDKIIQYLNIPYVANKDFIDRLKSYRENPQYDFLTLVIPMHASDDGFNEARFKYLLFDLIEESLADRTNYFEQAVVCFKYTKGNHLREVFENVKQEIIDQANQTLEPSLLLRTVLNSIKHLKNYSDIDYPEVLNKQIEVYPQYQMLDKTEKRMALAKFNENKWFYESGLSDNLLSYHALFIDADPIEIYKLIWEGMKQNIPGLFIYESVMSYQLKWDEDKQINHRLPMDNLYNNPMRNGMNNGDGFLFYPGRDYKLEEPIDSIRLHYIKDAITDFQLVEKYKKIASEVGVDSSILLDKLYDKLSQSINYIEDIRRPLQDEIIKLLREIS